MTEKQEQAIYKAAHRGIGRNDRCPCGSGKKYKKCCGSPLRDNRASDSDNYLKANADPLLAARTARQAADHEAAHCVVACHHEIPLDCSSISTALGHHVGSTGCCAFDIYRDFEKRFDKRTAAKKLISMCLAGIVLDYRQTGSWIWGVSDTFNVWLFSCFILEPPMDLGTSIAVRNLLDNPERRTWDNPHSYMLLEARIMDDLATPEFSGLIDELKCEVEALLDRYDNASQAIAVELVRKQQLTGEEIKMIFEKQVHVEEPTSFENQLPLWAAALQANA